ncbi:anoctamin-7-like isoform X4 [Branchiostoma lanceolatum]|uniref:anoctamin-7-like isoform X4 n=1 Tax=Branchiostoma lanceolatum TaxID=7740 RepID=UPI0034524368
MNAMNSILSKAKTEKNGLAGIALDSYGSTDDSVAFVHKDSLSENHPPSPGDLHAAEQGIYFRDGRRRIDFVLVFEEEDPGSKKSKRKKKKAAESGEVKEKSPEEKNDQYRKKFLNNLRKAGCEMEEEISSTGKKTITYIKVFASWDVLCYYAEELNFRAPLQAHPNPSENWSAKLLESLHIPNMMDQEVPNKPLDYYTCVFKKSKLDKFLGSENRDTFFSNTQRHRIVYEILATTPYGKRKRAEIGIDRLIDEGAFQAAYPLHDGSWNKPSHSIPAEQLNRRQVLYDYWARWGCWYKYQPLDHIREYFGEKIGIYFAWLGLYTAWLLSASIVGLMVFLYGVLSISTNTPAREVCNSGGDFVMCPLCDENIGCAYWNLSDTCTQAKIAYLFDHPGTVFFAIFMSFWAVTFLEYWKRKNASLAHHWDVMDFEEEEERPRPAFSAMAPSMEKNPVTGIKEPHFPDEDRFKRMMAGSVIIIFMMVMVLIFVLGVIMYRVLISIPLFQSVMFRAQASNIANMSGACVNLILIMASGIVYQKIAEKLTEWEMHRTQTEHEDSYTFKVFIFQFVNFYSSIFYIAFFKGRFVGYPGHYNRFFGLRNEACGQGGCLVELAQQLAVIMIGKQVINNAQEIIVPKIKNYLQRREVTKGMEKSAEPARWEEDYQLIENEGLFEEYLEMVIQFGFITIFVAAFPLAPLFALLNNWVEIRLDAHKYVCEVRRSVSERAQDIGVWFNILDALVQLAVISNAFIIAVTSEFLPRLLYKYEKNWNLDGYVNFTLAYSPPGAMSQECRYKEFRDRDGSFSLFYWRLLAIRLGFVILFEHVVFFISRLIDIMVPDIPESLEIKIKRERYLAKQALQDQEHIMEAMKEEKQTMAGGLAGVGEEDEGGDDDFAVTTQGRKAATRTDAGNVYLSVPTADV